MQKIPISNWKKIKATCMAVMRSHNVYNSQLDI